MRSRFRTLLFCLAFAAGVFFWLRPTEVRAQTCTASITGGGTFTTIQAAVNAAAVGNTILVSGVCNENVVIPEGKDRITLDGQSTATSTISGPDLNIPSVRIRGRRVTVRRFTITGAAEGVFVSDGGTAIIDGNLIQAVGTEGVVVRRHSFATVINNTIQNNPGDGISISENSAARIGFSGASDTTASPNTIQANQGRGVRVRFSSNARVAGNTIINNISDGIAVTGVSYGDLSNNVINNNGGDGVSISENSGVNLGRDTGTTIFDLPNTTTVNNAGVGVRCTINSYAESRLGTLNGAAGATNFSGGCINSLI